MQQLGILLLGPQTREQLLPWQHLLLELDGCI
jgi:hypothetical protein